MRIVCSNLTRSRRLARAGAVLSALLLASALPGCAVYQKCGFKGCPGDAQITANVKAALAEHTALEPVYVQTLDSVVYLSGTVSTEMQAGIATEVARQVQGVSRVVSLMNESN